MRYLARHLTTARLPTPEPPGRGHDTGAAVTCAFTAMARIWRGCPGHSPELPARPCGTGAGGLPVPPAGQPLVPTGPQAPGRIFSNHSALAGEVFTFGADLGRRGS